MNKFRVGKYRESDAMSRLISENSSTLLVLSRFGIALGFGDKSIGEVCVENQVDTSTFLAIIQLMSDTGPDPNRQDVKISIPSLINYLRNSHTYFLEYRLPEIRRHLTQVLNGDQADLNKAVLEYFDQFVLAVRKHMLHENNKVFPNIADRDAREKQVAGFKKQHEQIETRLTEFKNILIKYYPACYLNEMYRFLFDIFTCEQELTLHNSIEDNLFLPSISL